VLSLLLETVKQKLVGETKQVERDEMSIRAEDEPQRSLLSLHNAVSPPCTHVLRVRYSTIISPARPIKSK
jgi:hypothetical protein